MGAVIPHLGAEAEARQHQYRQNAARAPVRRRCGRLGGGWNGGERLGLCFGVRLGHGVTPEMKWSKVIMSRSLEQVKK
jgi:hypothetical protein